MICSNCGTDNRAGRKFCSRCAAPLVIVCSRCQAQNEPGELFCGDCAAPLQRAAGGHDDTQPASGPVPQIGSAPGPVAERRLVTILFADLVGFTTLAEGRDAEDTRELLSRYFDLSRDVIGRYGGTVEKFIGDAVMAVWGAPTAHEDDAERAVRAALELLDEVRTIGPSIQARAGVLTGEAAVTLGATNQGMVAGDLVNTASRLQSVALPGTVLVGEATQRAAGRAIAFEPAGEQILKGKAAPVPAWRALRVVAERGGRNRAETLEAPFVGRDEELRQLKDLFHATSREKRARLVSVVGPAGIGKTRLAWEFLKYADGLVENVWWHDGRSPAYGDGISFWALGEMVRERARLLETDDEPTTRARIAETLAMHVSDPDERRWIEPALLTLLGVASDVRSEQLFGAWRTFFERLAATAPVVLVFEDFHFADSGLIDFVDHLMEWTRNVPIYVVTLSRPELLEKRPDWGAGKRSFTSIYLEPLAPAAMRELLAGLVPGLPAAAVKAIVERADGIPLYAVETVRMLLAEGRLALDDGAYRPVGDLTALAVPETLTALIASRLDGLPPEDRALVSDAAVLGQSFTLAGLSAVSGIPEADLEPRLRGFVRRELLTLEADARSPERGQYAFVQALIREVAYNTLARADRKTRHLAAARFFESLDTDELAGGLAGHYLAAHQNAGEGAEADALAGQARIALKAAAARAASLGSHDQAVAFLEQALTAMTEPAERAATWLEIAASAEAAAEMPVAQQYLRDAADWYREHGSPEAAAAASAQLGRVLVMWGRVEPAIALLERVLDSDAASDATAAELWSQLARARMLHNENGRAIEDADRSLAAAATVDAVGSIADALITKGTAMMESSRFREGVALLIGAHALAVSNRLAVTELRAVNNLAIGLYGDRPLESLAFVRTGLDQARRLGDRGWLLQLGRLSADLSFEVGEWDVSLALLDDLEQGPLPDEIAIHFAQWRAQVMAVRGEPAEAERLLASVDAMLDRITNPFQRAHHLKVRSLIALAANQLDTAFDRGLQAARESGEMLHRGARQAGFAAVCKRDEPGVRLALDLFEEGGLQGTQGQADRLTMFGAAAALAGRSDEALIAYRRALGLWRDLRLPWNEALCAIGAVTVLEPSHPDIAAAAGAARDILSRLQARPFLDLLDVALARPAHPTARSILREPEGTTSA